MKRSGLVLGILAVSFQVAQAKPARHPALISVDEVNAEAQTEVLKLSEIQRQIRLRHAHELLGKHYRRSVVRSGEKVARINRQIYRWTKRMLPAKYRSDYKKLAQAIIDESLKYEFDPVFLLSVIQGESSFNPAMRGKLDEIGLMQIRPETAKWIAKKFDLEYSGEKSLFDPVVNVRLGSAFLSYLRERFDSQAQLYIAAYNMGQGNVAGAQSRRIWPKDYPTHVMRRYVEFYTELRGRG